MDYVSKARTNYFRVTDEKRYEELLGKYMDEDGIGIVGDFTDCSREEKWHCFGVDGNVDAIDDAGESALERFMNGISEIVHPEDAFVIKEVGAEGFRYLCAFAAIVTRDSDPRFVDFDSTIISTVRELVDNPDYSIEMEY